MKRVLTALLLFCLSLSCAGCSVYAPADGDKLQIITTNFPPYDFVRQIAGDNAEITMLLAPGEESHTFEPTPQDIIRLTQADLFILGGGKSDQWALKLIESAEIDKEKTLFMMDCIPQISQKTEDTPHAHEVHHSHSDFYEYDEHVWTSPENAKAICRHITERIIAADERNAPIYQKNWNTYMQELSALDEAFSHIVETGVRKTVVFADRFPFRYFAEHYGLTYFAAFPGCSDETEPDAATMKFLVDIVKEDGIPAVFHTELSNRKIADAICEATGAGQLLFHSCHTVTKEEFERGETYVSLMKQNAAMLKEALS